MIVFSIFYQSCEKERLDEEIQDGISSVQDTITKIVKDWDAFDSIVRVSDLIPQPTIIEDPQLLNTAEDNSNNDTIDCVVKHYEWAPGYEEPLLLDPASDVIYPGAFLRAESITEGAYTPLPANRAPLKLSVSLENINGNVSGLVNEPSNISEVRQTIKDLLSQGITGTTSANVVFKVERIYEREQFKLAIGANFGGFWGKVNSSFSWNSVEEKSRFLVKFQQIYYTIDIDIPNKPSLFFEEIPSWIHTNTYSPVYVSSVKYGRVALFMIESSKSAADLESALNASFNGIVNNGGVNVSSEYKKIVNESKMSALIMGGSGAEAVGSIGGFEPLKNYILTGGNYSKDSPSAPLSYTLRFLKDNSIAKIVLNSKYNVRECNPVASDEYVWKAPPTDYKVLCPERTLGDNSFGHNGIDIEGEVELQIKYTNEVWAAIKVNLREWHGGNTFGDTRAKVDRAVKLFTLPANKQFLYFKTPKYGIIDKYQIYAHPHGLQEVLIPKNKGAFLSKYEVTAPHDYADFPCDGTPHKSLFILHFDEVTVRVRNK